MRIVDTHLHLVDLDRFTYPWLAGAPTLNKPWDATAYFQEAGPLGIETALHMEVDVAEKDMEAETEFMLGVHPQVGGAIAAARPEHQDFAAHIERLAAMSGVKGVRRILHTQPDALSQRALFADNVRRLEAAGLNFDLCVLARQLPIGRALATKCPSVQFVLDHCGVPDIAGGGLDPWRAEIRRMAELPNVAAKISGVVAYAKPGWTIDDIRPYVEHVIECFGWDRVVWGSDHPVCTLTANLTRWVETTRALVSGASQSEQARLFHRNAERIYRLPKKATGRYGRLLGLKPEAIAEYRRVHEAVWPLVLKQIKNSNISNYSIYLREPENLLLAYYEYTGDDHDGDMAKMAADPATQKWWELCMPMQQPLATVGKDDWWAGMAEVFHID